MSNEKIILLGIGYLEQMRETLNEVCCPQTVILYRGLKEIDRFNTLSEKEASIAISDAQNKDPEIWGGYKPVDGFSDFPIKSSFEQLKKVVYGQ